MHRTAYHDIISLFIEIISLNWVSQQAEYHESGIIIYDMDIFAIHFDIQIFLTISEFS